MHFIKDFNRIAIPLTAILKTTESSFTAASRVDGGGGARTESLESVDGSDTSRKILTKSKSQRKFGQLGNNINIEESKFLTSEAKETFKYLRQVFIKALIF